MNEPASTTTASTSCSALSVDPLPSLTVLLQFSVLSSFFVLFLTYITSLWRMLPEESEGFTDRTETFLGKLLFPLVMVWYYRLLPGRSSLRLAQSFFYLHLYRAAENSDETSVALTRGSLSGADLVNSSRGWFLHPVCNLCGIFCVSV